VVAAVVTSCVLTTGVAEAMLGPALIYTSSSTETNYLTDGANWAQAEGKRTAYVVLDSLTGDYVCIHYDSKAKSYELTDRGVLTAATVPGARSNTRVYTRFYGDVGLVLSGSAGPMTYGGTVVVAAKSLKGNQVQYDEAGIGNWKVSWRLDKKTEQSVAGGWTVPETVEFLKGLLDGTGYLETPEGPVYIPGGTFAMGDSLGDGALHELPVHAVTLDPFYMSRCEITNQQYCEFLNAFLVLGQITVTAGVVYQADSGTTYPYCDTLEAHPESQIEYSAGVFTALAKGGRDISRDPAQRVSWYGAAAYCNWRSIFEGLDHCYDPITWDCDFTKNGYRLPTEAQWEYAARGGVAAWRFPWGDTISHTQANYWSSLFYAYDVSLTGAYHPTWNDGVMPYTSPGGSYLANRYGLCDMAGNVLEWCNDRFGDYSAGLQTNPTGPAAGAGRVYRGGSWFGDASDARMACRDAGLPTDRFNTVGFRVVRDVQ